MIHRSDDTVYRLPWRFHALVDAANPRAWFVGAAAGIGMFCVVWQAVTVAFGGPSPVVVLAASATAFAFAAGAAWASARYVSRRDTPEKPWPQAHLREWIDEVRAPHTRDTRSETAAVSPASMTRPVDTVAATPRSHHAYAAAPPRRSRRR